MRRLLQGHLDLRSDDDAGVAVMGQDGVLRTHRRERSVPLRTIVGDVTIARTTYAARGMGSLAPLDAALNLPASAQSFGVLPDKSSIQRLSRSINGNERWVRNSRRASASKARSLASASTS